MTRKKIHPPHTEANPAAGMSPYLGMDETASMQKCVPFLTEIPIGKQGSLRPT